MVFAYAALIFVSAGLLFLVQPLLARELLPLLGGSPGVWNTCMVFFQASLLAGYLYAHLVVRNLRPRVQVVVHATLLALALATLPIGLPSGWRPEGAGSPIAWLLAALATSVGLPFLALSATAPLVQSWFSTTRHRRARDPYFLYAASNAGSLLALLAYPLAIEPALALAEQRGAWSAAFALLALGLAALGFASVRDARDAPVVAPLGAAGVARDAATPEPLSAFARLRCVLLAAVPSSLMLGVTQHFATDIATFPLLWIVPLALYLSSFVVTFSRLGPLALRASALLVPAAVLAVVYLLALGAERPVGPQLVVHLFALLSIGVLCHARLAALRPPAARLTEYYAWLSLGGVLGGAFNALVSPVVFTGVVEYPLALVLACALRARDASGGRVRLGLDLVLPALLVPLLVGAPSLVQRLDVQGLWIGLSRARLAELALPVAVCLCFAGRRLRFTLGVATLLGFHLVWQSARPLHAERTFFGVLRVTREANGGGHWTHLFSGTTRHGSQFTLEPWSLTPTTYYTRGGPAGEVLTLLAADERPRELALVGLGIGTIAAYGRPDWRMTYYEIDPAVERIARDPALFTYLADTRSPVEVVIGDARLELAEAEPGRFDVVVLDAFSSDAVPVHLITREAVSLYLEKLAPEGLLLFHVTNWRLELTSVVAAVARELGLAGRRRDDLDVSDEQFIFERKDVSLWIVLARDEAHLGAIADDPRWWSIEPPPGAPVWTDDYSNVLGVVRWDPR